MIAIALAAFIRFGPQLMLGNIEPSDPFYPLTQKIVALTSTSEVTFVLAAVVLGGLYAIFIYAPKHQTD